MVGFGVGGGSPSSDMPNLAVLPALSVTTAVCLDSDVSGTLKAKVKLPLSSVGGESDMATSSNFSDVVLLMAKPCPVTVTSWPISGNSGSRLIVGRTLKLAAADSARAPPKIALKSWLPAVVSGMMNGAEKLPKPLLVISSSVSLPSNSSLMFPLVGKPVPLTLTVLPGETGDGAAFMSGSTVNRKP